MDLDPDVDIPLLAFEEKQALEKRGFARSVVKYQAALIFPLSLLQAISMLHSSIEFLAAKKAKSTLVEALMICAHFALYFGLLFSVLEPLQALLFIAVHRGLFGTYMVSIFAPNHKAMPLLERDSKVDFLRRQVLTSRNVIAHPITDFWYGGLNYQIEHHLFPRLPRNKLREAQPIIRGFCLDHSIAYHETSVFQSYKRSCSIFTRSARQKQERRGDGAADQAHIGYEQIDTRTGKPLQASEPHRAVRQRIRSPR